MTNAQKFFALLQKFYQKSNQTFDELDSEIYVGGIEPVGIDRALEALMNIARNKGLGRIPSVGDILEAAGIKQPDEKDEANEIVGRCVEAITKFGYPNPTGAAAYIGEIGWAAINAIGTWDSFTETNPDQMATTRAQLRDMCKSKRAMASVGRLELPSVKKEELSDVRSDILTLAEGIMKNGKQSEETSTPF